MGVELDYMVLRRGELWETESIKWKWLFQKCSAEKKRVWMLFKEEKTKYFGWEEVS